MAAPPQLTSRELPPSNFNSLPALEPPPGVKSNLVNPENKGPILTSICIILMSLVLILYANRIYVKTCIIRRMTWDDRAYSLLRLSCSAELTAFFSHMLNRVGRFSGAASVYVQGPSNTLTIGRCYSNKFCFGLE